METQSVRMQTFAKKNCTFMRLRLLPGKDPITEIETTNSLWLDDACDKNTLQNMHKVMAYFFRAQSSYLNQC